MQSARGSGGTSGPNPVHEELTTGSGGQPAKGEVTSELIVKFFHGEFTPQGFKRYSGMWKGPPPGTIGKKDRPSVRRAIRPTDVPPAARPTCRRTGGHPTDLPTDRPAEGRLPAERVPSPTSDGGRGDP